MGPALPPVVVVPGLGLGAEAVDPTLRELVAGGQVVLLPTYGCSVDADADLSMPALGARLLAEVEARSGKVPVILVGHSSSCQVVAEAARLARDRVAGLVLVGPTTDPRSRSWPQLAQRWLRTAVWERPTQLPVLVRCYARTGLRSMARGMDVARRHDVGATLREADVPVLVVRGRHDRIAPADWCSSLGPTVTLPVGAHMLPLTHGDLLAAQVDRWADRLR
jgi:pimeloyl-ACP methyl ester carboxylesterase